MHENANTVPSVHRATDVREALSELNVVQEGIAEPLGGGRKTIPSVG